MMNNIILAASLAISPADWTQLTNKVDALWTAHTNRMEQLARMRKRRLENSNRRSGPPSKPYRVRGVR